MQTGASLAGQRVGYIRRQSGIRQEGNNSTIRQLEEFPAWLVSQGATAIPFDEGIISGRDLAKRDTARRLLKLIRDGELDALGTPEIDRLTRDEHGIDAGVIAEVLIAAHALLVTYRRTYNLRDKDDLFQYKLDCGLAGREMQSIRDRMWAAVFTEAERRPFFMGTVPTGYTTRLEEGRGTGATARLKVKRIAVRDDEQAPMMRALADALDECACVGDVVARLNRERHFPPAATGKFRGQARKWDGNRVWAILNNPLYYGVWRPFSGSDRCSEIWDAVVARDGSRRQQTFELVCPDLAWYTREQVERWAERMRRPADAPARRHRTYDHLYRGVVCCVTCGRPMIGAGRHGYSCPTIATYATRDLCATPQQIVEHAIVRALRDELPNAIRARADAEAVLRQQLQHTPELDALRDEAAILQSQIDQMMTQYYPVGRLVDVPSAIVRRMQDCDTRLREVTADIAAKERVLATSAETTALVASLLADPLPAFDRQSPGRQAAILGRVFADVLIEARGWAAGRTYRLVAYTNLLTHSLVRGEDACTSLAYLRSLLGEREP